MKKEIFVVLGVLMLLVGFVSADVNDVNIEEVQINGITLNPSDTTKLSIDRGEYLNIRVTLSAIADTSDVVLRAFVDGYEHSDYQDISDRTPIFDMEAGVRYVKRLHLKLPLDMNKDYYTIKLLVSDRYGEIKEFYYNIKVDVPRHDLIVKDVVLNPGEYVKAGSYLTAFVRVKNIGEKTEKDVKVTVAIPELGVSGSDYIDEIDPEDAVSTEEIALRIPECTKEGDYNIIITALYNDEYNKAEVKKKVHVSPSEFCPTTEKEESGKLIISIPTTSADVKAGEKAVFTMTIVNTGKEDKNVVFAVSNNNWATVVLSDTSVMVKSNEAKIVKVEVTPNDNVTGSKVFNLEIKTNGKSVQKVPFTVNVEEKTENTTSNTGTLNVAKIKTALEIGIVILVIILVIVVLLLALKKNNTKNQEKSEEEGSYY